MPSMGVPSMGMNQQPVTRTAPIRSMSAFEAPAAQSTVQPTQPVYFPTRPFGTQSLSGPQRPASTPLTNLLSASTAGADRPAAAPLLPMKTGSRNPFAPSTEIAAPPPPLPTIQPTLNALRTGAPWMMPSHHQPNGGLPTLAESPVSEVPKANGDGAPPSTSVMSGIASSFAKPEDQNKNQFHLSAFSGSTNFPSFSTSTATASKPNAPAPTPFPGAGQSTTPFSLGALGSTNGLDNKPAANPLATQPTGFAGSSVKPFQPTSSFGASLLASLPPVSSETPAPSSTLINGPNASTGGMPAFGGASFSGASSLGTGTSSAPTGVTSAPTGASSFSGLSSSTSATSQPSQIGQPSASQSSFSQSLGPSSSFGNSLMPQVTGMPNPFRASMFNPGGATSPPFPGVGGTGPVGSTPFASQLFAPSGNLSASTSPFGQPPFSQQPQKQSTPFGSLI
ncbi:hypothetical protein DACRYDRAFT_93852 [Dacryopinax primogenitus]|uniref:Uncharacterized protein n=1 Tax=Dacryopinax primogenitus (strain DJM 731) TaxID=1858805 RepID=M5GER9_DACPD|nr:uncharacterized protein DACRYDRAFT_93852 [Dacryopinax primogenitus]EJU03523.1 hypothetical protein DACRYDRAFT_93852 [Dacryopinax primogenitus]